MSTIEQPGSSRFGGLNKLRDRLSASLGVEQDQKEEIYIQLSRSASLRDVSYWLQIFFSAGIATLGLVLNSPAVIIGAMLISPLMGPILAYGLALASGDMILGVRAFTNITLSYLLAVLFAVLLVGLLPFKEMTSEIAARTQPNTLDLLIALFSGAVGSIATCKGIKGVGTSIPGVAISVALMPPLCVVGFGIGIAISVSGAEGWRIARGGGLLFLTNLVAIAFTAMVVFVLLRINTERAKKRVRDCLREDKENIWIHHILSRIPAPLKLRRMGTLRARFLSIIVMILLISIPLYDSFSQLQQEIARKQQENQIRQAATELWRKNFASLEGGEPRSYIGQINTSSKNDNLTLLLRVFTSKPCTIDEKAAYVRQVATHLGRPPDSIKLQLVEIPTASGELLARAREDASQEDQPEEAVVTITQLQENLWQGIKLALHDLRLPSSMHLVDYEATTSDTDPLRVKLSYLCDHDLEDDAAELITDDVRARLNNPAASVGLERIEVTSGPIGFRRNQASLTGTDITLLDQTGKLLKQKLRLRVEIIAGAERREPKGIAEERAQAIYEYLNKKWGVQPEKLAIVTEADSSRSARLNFRLGETVNDK